MTSHTTDTNHHSPSSTTSLPFSSASSLRPTSPSSTSLPSLSTSRSTPLSRLSCIRSPLFAGVASRLSAFAGYHFLLQARVCELGYHTLLAAAATYILAVSGWQLMSIIVRVAAIWICLRTLITLGLHATHPSLHKYYQHPPRLLRIMRQTTRAVSLVLLLASLVVSTESVLSTDPDNALLAIWCLFMADLCLTLCSVLVYGALHLVFRNRDLSTLFPFIQPAAFPSFTSASSITPGLTVSELSQLPCYKYRAELVPSLAEDGCVICLCGVNEGETVRVLRCGHGFHRTCADEWLQRRSVCPLCVQVVQVGSPAVERQAQVELMVQQLVPGVGV